MIIANDEDDMLSDLIDALVDAVNRESKKDMEKAYRDLEKVGVDKMTASLLAIERVLDKRSS